MIEHVAVIVPAADEQERIGGCLEALEVAAQELQDVADVSVAVTVVLDGCRDGTAEAVAGFPHVRTVTSTARCVGAARACGTRAALAGAGPLERVWTAHTDADSQVPTDWLAGMLAAADAGADLVLGTVTPSLELPLPVRRAWQDLHSVEDDHPHIHGANLGIRATTLQALGGWRSLRSGEDVDLVARAMSAGVHIRRTGSIRVHTSARPIGRAPGGFSSYLRALSGFAFPAVRIDTWHEGPSALR